MTERERWIVYPLLFLALGASLRDKLVDRTTTKSIVCQELRVVDEETGDGQPPRDLARIGRKPSGGTNAYFIINGDVEIIDPDPAGIQPARTLLKIGRTIPPPGAPSTGYAVLSGQILIDGNINAKQYFCQGIPFMPVWHPVPGVSVPDLLNGLKQLGQPSPPASKPKKSSPAAPPAGKEPPAPK